MAVKTNAFNFSDTMKMVLEDLHLEAVEQLTIEIPKVAKEAAKKLQSTTEIGGTGAYKKSWTYEAEKGRMQVGATVYADAPGFRLAHLLEHGYAMRRGGRVIKDVKGKEHIKPVEEWANNEAYDRIVEALERKMR